MAWIESHQSLSKHRKTLRAAALLQVNRHLLIGHLHELWWWALNNVPADGYLGDLTDEEIAQGADWPGDPTEFVRALTEAGFIDETENGRYLHDWHDYAGKYLEQRARDAERKRAERRRKLERHPTPVQQTSDGHPADVQPNQTIPNLTSTPDDDDDHAPASDESEAPDPKAECLALIARRRPDWVLSGERYREFLSYEDRLPWDVIRTAVDKTLAAGAKDLRYCLRILETYVENQVQTVADVQALDAEHERLKRQHRTRGSPDSRNGASRFPPASNVILKRDKKDDSYYEAVFKRFD